MYIYIYDYVYIYTHPLLITSLLTYLLVYSFYLRKGTRKVGDQEGVAKPLRVKTGCVFFVQSVWTSFSVSKFSCLKVSLCKNCSAQRFLSVKKVLCVKAPVCLC